MHWTVRWADRTSSLEEESTLAEEEDGPASGCMSQAAPSSSPGEARTVLSIINMTL